jgi:hypothetical protein
MVAEFAFDVYISIDCPGASTTPDIKGYNGLGVGVCREDYGATKVRV